MKSMHTPRHMSADVWKAYSCPNESWSYGATNVPCSIKNNLFCIFFSASNPLMKRKGEKVKSFFLAYPSLPLPTAWLTDWPAVKGAFVSALWRKANQILRVVCLREENGAPGMPSAAEMCRQSDCWGRLGLLWPFQNYAGGITCLAHGQRESFYKGLWLFIYLFT